MTRELAQVVHQMARCPAGRRLGRECAL